MGAVSGAMRGGHSRLRWLVGSAASRGVVMQIRGEALPWKVALPCWEKLPDLLRDRPAPFLRFNLREKDIKAPASPSPFRTRRSNARYNVGSKNNVSVVAEIKPPII